MDPTVVAVAVAFLIGVVIVVKLLAAGGPAPAADDGPPPQPPARDRFDEVRRLVAANQKIAAIKVYRELTGLGLKESKDAIDELERGRPLPTNVPVAPLTVPPGVASSPADPEPTRDMAGVERLARSGQYIHAIKLYRELTNAGLAEAKAAVDRMRA